MDESVRLRPLAFAVTLFTRNDVSSEEWWTRMQYVRTAAAMPLEVAILEVDAAPIYQQVAMRARHLEELGMSRAAIARRLGLDWKTVARALNWIRSVGSE